MSISDHIKRWFGYSRRERTGTFVLATIIIIIVVLKSTLFTGIDHDQDWTSVVGSDTINLLSSGEGQSDYKEPVLREFDPNMADIEDLQSLGLTFRQASTIINYRTNGGQFKKAEDFRRIYGISEGKKDTLIKYIRIEKVETASTNRFATPLINPISDRGSGVDQNRVQAPIVSTPTVIELNCADSSGLVRLKGIGPVLSVRIIKYRDLLGGFHSIDQLSEVYGIDSVLVDLLRGDIFVDISYVHKIDINSADFSRLLRHPYLSYDQVASIIRYRTVAGDITRPGELVVNKILSREEFARIEPYLSAAKQP
jgi:DNA uptake protein ComE-like DNA-binding protein